MVLAADEGPRGDGAELDPSPPTKTPGGSSSSTSATPAAGACIKGKATVCSGIHVY